MLHSLLLSLLPVQASPPGGPAALDPAVWTQVGARVPSLVLHRVDGTGPADLADLVRTKADGAPAKRTLLIRFASW